MWVGEELDDNCNRVQGLVPSTKNCRSENFPEKVRNFNLAIFARKVRKII
jgi:hypothetical protein